MDYLAEASVITERSRKTWDVARIYWVKCLSKPQYVNNDIL